MLEPSWLGRRVSIRRALDHVSAGVVQFGDVVGDLVGLDPRIAVVDTRSGPVEVDRDRIAIARLVPPSTADELALEAIAARGLRPADEQRLGDWLLRTNGGFTHRANSVLPLGRPGRPLDEALRFVHDWYAERGLPVQLHIPIEARRLLDAELAERGWPAELLTQMLVGRLDMLAAAAAGPPVEIASAPDDAWLALYRGGQGLSEPARSLLTRHDSVGFASLRVAGRTVAVGRAAVDGGWLGVMAVEVAPDHRRQGLAAAVMAALWQWGAARGARRGYLQVAAENAPALALYTKLGYRVHHDYHYRREPGVAAPRL